MNLLCNGMIYAIETPASYSRGQQINNGDKPMSAVRTRMEHGLSGDRKAPAACFGIQTLRVLENSDTTIVNFRSDGKIVLKRKLMSPEQLAEAQQPEVLIAPPMIPNTTV